MASISVPSVTGSSICPVCKDTPQDPRVLPCEHQVCAHCLQQHVSASTTTDNRFQCPECRVECELLGGEVAEMYVNGGNVSKPPVDTSASSAALCTNGDHGSATVFCPDCDEFYCETCSSNHQSFKVFSGHSVITVDEVSHVGSAQAQSTSSLRDSTCKQHKQTKLSTYCKTCQGCICTTCASEEHKDHWFQDLVEAGIKARKELEDMLAKTTGYIMRQDDTLEEMMQTKKNINASMETSKEGIKKMAHRAREIINNHERSMLRDLERHESRALSKLESIIQVLERDKTSAVKFEQEAENLCQLGMAVELVERTSALQKQFNVRSMSTIETMSWAFDVDRKQEMAKSLTSLLGSVKLNITPVVKSGKTTMIGKLVYQIPLRCDNVVTALVAIGDCMCVKHGDDPHLWLYDMDRGYTKQCEDLGLKSTHGMALLQPVGGTAVVVNSNKLHFVRISASLTVTLLRVKDIPVKEAVSISACRETRELFICQKNSSEVVIFDQEGNERKRISVPYDYSSHYPHHVTRTDDGFAILVRGNQGVNFLNENGDERHKYTYGDNNSEWVKTQNMITDKEGRLILPDTDNHKVHLINTNGRFSQFLLTEDDGIEYPEYVYLDEDSARLYIVHRPSGSREVRVYKWSTKSGDVLTTNYKLDAQLNKFQYEF